MAVIPTINERNNTMKNMNCTVLALALLALTMTTSQTRAQSIYTPHTFTNFAGLPEVSGSADGSGSAARFYYPTSVAVDSAGNLYVMDINNHRISKGVPATPSCPPTSATVSVLASGPPLIDPVGVVSSPDESVLYINDYTTNAILRMPSSGGTPTVIASGGPLENARGIAISPDGSMLYIAGFGTNQILKLPATGGTPTVLASGGPLIYPHGIAISPNGATLYIADNYAGAVFSLPATGGTPTLLHAGSPFGYASAGPTSVSVSLDGTTLYVVNFTANVFSNHWC